MNILHLPPELLDGLISEVDRPRDLLNLALSCKLLCSLIDPHHLHTRILEFHPRQATLCSSIAALPVYASRYRSIEINSRPRRTPPTFLKNLGNAIRDDTDTNKLDGIIADALPTLTRLNKFSWNSQDAPPSSLISSLKHSPQKLTDIVIQHFYCSEPLQQHEILQELCAHFPALHTLSLSRGLEMGPLSRSLSISDELNEAYWPSLRRLRLHGYSADTKILSYFFGKHHHIEHLSMDSIHSATYPSSLRRLSITRPPVGDDEPLSVQNVQFLQLPMSISRLDSFFKVVKCMPNLSVLVCSVTHVPWITLSKFPKYFRRLTKLLITIHIGSGAVTIERLCSVLESLHDLTHLASVVPNTEDRPQHTVDFVINRIATRSATPQYLHIGPDGRGKRLNPYALRDWYRIIRTPEGGHGTPIEDETKGVTVNSWYTEFDI